MHAKHWLRCGPQAFLTLARLVDPVSALPIRLLHAAYSQAQALNLAFCFRRLTMLRALGGDAAAKSFLIHTAPDGEDDDLQAQVLAHLTGDSTPELLNRADFLGQHINHLMRLNMAATKRDVDATTVAVADAFLVDRDLPFYLDWKLLHHALPRRWGAPSTGVVLCAALFDDETVWAKCEGASHTRGRGAFVVLLEQLVLGYRQAHKSDSIGPLIKDLQRLPEGAGKYLTLRIASKSMLERLPYALILNGSEAAPVSARDERTSTVVRATARARLPEERRVTINRLRLVSSAVEANLIDATYAQQITDQEMRVLWALTWREISKNGKIRINELLLAERVSELLGRNYAVTKFLQEKQTYAAQRGAPSLITTVLAEQVTYELLLGEGWCLASSLSSNLKHGVIGPRILRAFADPSATGSGAAHNARDLLQSNIAVVRQLINDFMSSHLSVRVNDPFYLRVRERVAGVLVMAWGAANSADLKVVVADIASALFDEMKAFVDAARGQFEAETGKRIKREISRAIDTLPRNDAYQRYGLGLHEQIERALNEVAMWMQVASPGEEQDFTLDALVDYEIQNFLIREREHMKVKVHHTIQGKRAREAFTFSGPYLEVMYQSIHNLIQNAVTYSGRGLDTEVDIWCDREGKDIVLICENSFARDRRKELADKVASARESASGPLANAKKSKNSGLAKIRAASVQALAIEPAISIDDLEPRDQRYRISIRWPDAFPRMIVERA